MSKHGVSPDKNMTRCAAWLLHQVGEAALFSNVTNLSGKRTKTFLSAHKNKGKHGVLAGQWGAERIVMVYIQVHVGPRSLGHLEQKSGGFLRQSSQKADANWLPSQPVAQLSFKANDTSFPASRCCIEEEGKSPCSLISNSEIKTRSLSSPTQIFRPRKNQNITGKRPTPPPVPKKTQINLEN